MLGLFDFKTDDCSTPAPAILHDSTWLRLNEICEARSILPTTVELIFEPVADPDIEMTNPEDGAPPNTPLLSSSECSPAFD